VGRQIQETSNPQVFVGAEPWVFDQPQFEASTMSDSALQREILGLFFDQVVEALDRLKLGPLSADEIKFMGHTLRGAAAAIGAIEIEKLAADFGRGSHEHATFEAGLVGAIERYRKATQSYLPSSELH
jgi:hypothetical protein